MEIGWAMQAAQDAKPRPPIRGWTGRESGAVFHGPPGVVRLAATANAEIGLYAERLDFVNKLLEQRHLEGRKSFDLAYEIRTGSEGSH
jgi:hypothetical protein